MIPVLIVPVLLPQRIGAMLASVDVPVGRRIVIDNGAGLDLEGVITLPHNIGVAASWNLGIKLTPRAPWWFITNDDIVYAPGDLARLCGLMADASPRVVTLAGMASFGINRAALRAVGWFDEGFHPAYCEDADFEYRCRLAGVPMYPIPVALRHWTSSTIADPRYGRQNDRTYPANVDWFRRKWGGPLRGGEVFTRPFNGDDPGPQPDIDRLAELGWETTALEPVMETR